MVSGGGSRCGVLTVEIEHVDAVALAELEKEGVRVEPHAATLAVIQVGMGGGASGGVLRIPSYI